MGFAGRWGYQEDASGYKLLGHRYYDSSTGRFLTRDPAKDGRNWYSYCRNNPLAKIDPDGLSDLRAWIQGLLDIAGFIEPTPFCDIVNAIIHGAYGEWDYALLTILGILPYVGDLAKIAKYTAKSFKATKFAKKGAKTFEEFKKHLTDLSKGLKRLEDLKKKLQNAKSHSERKRLKKEIETELGRVKGHEKEMDQKWPGWRDDLQNMK